jgi:hypothetical protein
VWAGKLDGECVRVGGQPFEFTQSAFADAFALSWTTFSTLVCLLFDCASLQYIIAMHAYDPSCSSTAVLFLYYGTRVTAAHIPLLEMKMTIPIIAFLSQPFARLSLLLVSFTRDFVVLFCLARSFVFKVMRRSFSATQLSFATDVVSNLSRKTNKEPKWNQRKRKRFPAQCWNSA